MKKRILFLLAAVIISLSAIISCSSPSSTSDTTSDTTEIVIDSIQVDSTIVADSL